MPMMTVSPSCERGCWQTRPSKGSDAAGEAERVGVSFQHGSALLHLAASGSGLGAGLVDGGLALGKGVAHDQHRRQPSWRRSPALR